MAISVTLTGQDGTDEFKAGIDLKKMLMSEIPDSIEGEILISTNVTLFGQEVKDIDIVVIGKFGHGFKQFLKFRPKNDTEYINKNVYFTNFCFTVEVKKHFASDVQISPMNNVLVSYHNKKHDVTYQSEKQKYSLHRYFKNVEPVNSDVFVTNFIWLRNVDTKELNKLKNPSEHNILPKEFKLTWLLMLLLSQKKPYLNDYSNEKNSYYAFQCWKNASIDFQHFRKALDLFETVKKNVGNISRSHFERISKRILKEQKYAEAILDNSEKGGKFVIIQGKAGTGKTVKLLNIACDLCMNYGYRCLILTYNFTLVADIRRTLTLAHVPDGVGRESVRIMTLFKFFIDLFEAFGIYTDDNSLDDATFFANYPKYCKELSEFIKNNKQPNEDIESIMQVNHQLVSWDYIMIDEAQDWNPDEVEILYSIFGPSKIVISQAPDQKVRESNNPHWVKPKWRIHREYEQTNERKSFRQKLNLVTFVNQFAERFNLSWELEPNPEFHGGRIIITSAYTVELHKDLYKDCLDSGNKAYEMLFLVPPSLIENDGEKEITLKNGSTKTVKLRHCKLVDQFQGQLNFWDGTNKELRKDYPISIDQHRLIQYESCRGLEGWTVVCFEIDELVRYLESKYKEENSQNELALESPEERKNRYIYMWSLIPLTRAIDTLVITLKNPNSNIAEQLFKLYENNRSFIEWR